MKKSKEIFLNQICVEMYDEITRFMKYYVHDERILDDIVQETFMEAYKHIDTLVDHPNYKGWLYNTAKFKAKYMRSVQFKRDCMQKEIESLDTVENAIYDTHEELFYHELKRMLSDDEYRFLKLKYKYGYSYIEIAEQEGISVGACKMRGNRIIKKLRNIDKRG